MSPAVQRTRIESRGLVGENRREFFGAPQPLRADVQAALSVIARRTERQKEIEAEPEREGRRRFRLDLRRANLQSLDLAGAELQGADLSQARLEGAAYAGRGCDPPI